jgi:hypothetical protein
MLVRSIFPGPGARGIGQSRGKGVDDAQAGMRRGMPMEQDGQGGLGFGRAQKPFAMAGIVGAALVRNP